ncbi:MAG: hypothetical protein FWF82_05160 [Oscillospiraceae bacterium]|nr:hypothetical protein [Oscillospiraceae bacterium]
MKKNLLFAELIVVILFFSIASAACVTLFAESYKDGKKSDELLDAVVLAQNAAELFKELGGSVQIPVAMLREDSESMNMEIDIEVTVKGSTFTKAKITILRESRRLYEIDAVAFTGRGGLFNTGGQSHE